MSFRTCWTKVSTSAQTVDWKTLLTSLVSNTLFVACTEYPILEIVIRLLKNIDKRIYTHPSPVATPTVIILSQAVAYFPVFACVDAPIPLLGHVIGFFYTLLL